MADELRINGIDDLQAAQAGALNTGSGIPNYNDWHEILEGFADEGIQSTGSYEGDIALYNSMHPDIPLDAMQENQRIVDKDLEVPPDQKVGATENVTKLTDSDSDQNLKANFANATSATIAADYMKVFHQL